MLLEGMLIRIYKLVRSFKHFIPKRVQSIICAISGCINPRFKYSMSMDWWKTRCDLDGGKLNNSGYRGRLLAIAGEENADFLRGKIVADFGCGPRGSLQWCDQARIRIGIDVLADMYGQYFNIASHDMCYICSTERSIPLPSNYVDVLFTLNAMDHVHNFKAVCREIMRILSPGGEFIGSINLSDRVTITEPQALTEKRIKKHLLKYLEVISYRLNPKYSSAENKRINEDMNRAGDENSPAPGPGIQVLWLRAKKPSL
jgi:SAM-dependent methyltransferase